jgi:hypothetical protein
MVQFIPVVMIAALPALNQAAGQPQQSKEVLLRGIKQLAIAIDKMDDADAKCGLNENGVQAAAAKALAGNGLQVAATRQDFQPFLYMRTTSLHTSEGECITYLLATVRVYVSPPHLAWTPEQPAVSLEVVLEEHGGLIYSPEAAPHATAVATAVGRYVGRIAEAIKAANK